MKCLITGVETNNKWRGHPLCREIVQLAKEMENQPGFHFKTMRERILKLGEQWKERVREEAKKAKQVTE